VPSTGLGVRDRANTWTDGAYLILAAASPPVRGRGHIRKQQLQPTGVDVLMIPCGLRQEVQAPGDGRVVQHTFAP